MRYTVDITNGTTYWYREGTETLHRLGGPAAEYKNGSKMWYVNGKLHREDGPAIEWDDGIRCWYVNGKLHREDGPAVIRADGSKMWCIEGESLTEQQFLERTAPVKELSISDLEQLIGYRVKIVK